jgi:tetratricopeptide (TPR) repeat protein
MGYNNRANVYARREEYQKALEDYDRVIALFPKTTEELFKWENADQSPMNMSKSYTGRGYVHLALGDTDRAAQDFQRAREVFAMPVDADNLLLEGDRLMKAGRYVDAIWVYDRVLEWDPRDVRALNDRANAYSYLDRFPEAINDLTRVIALDPSFIVAYHNRGFAYAWAGKREKAAEDFRTACGRGFGPACANIDAVPAIEGQRRGGRRTVR